MSDRFDENVDRDAEQGEESLERATENVLEGWPAPPTLDDPPSLSEESPSGAAGAEEHDPDDDDALPRWNTAAVDEASGEDDSSEERPSSWAALDGPADPDPSAERAADESADDESDDEPEEEASDDAPAANGPRFLELHEHVPGELEIPPGVPVLEGTPRGERRAVGVVVSRFNGEVTSRLLESALDELELLGVSSGSITVMPVPGAFELPVAAMALAKTRRFACIVALGCVIRGDTPHFDYVASEAASGLQLASIETGVPVAFGLLTLDRPDQAEARYAKGAEAVRTALEMADLFANLRAAAAR